jgi:MFS family permease
MVSAPLPGYGRDYAWLFTSNVFAIFATGIATVGLALLAFDLAGDDSGIVLGTALSLKMAVNIVIPPIATAYAVRIDRRSWLIFLTLIRGGVLCLLPFVTQVYQIYLLIVVFETAAAAFRATYMAIIPDMLTDDGDYAGAVAKARIAYNVESMLSPLLAALLLVFIDFRGTFIAAVVAFLLAAAIMARVVLPEGRRIERDVLRQMSLSVRKMFASPIFRGATAVNAAATTIVAMVAVNTVVLVRGAFDLDDRSAAVALATFGAGGIVGALMSTRLITTYGVRAVMMRSGAAMAMLLVTGALMPDYASMLALWLVLGAASTL